MTREIIRGDSYPQFYVLTFLEAGGSPIDLTSSIIRTTYKPEVTTPGDDPDDDTAVIKHFIAIDGSGVVVDSDGLELDGPAENGVLVESLTTAETNALPLETQFISDVEANLYGGILVTTFMYLDDPIVAIDGVTNRTSDA